MSDLQDLMIISNILLEYEQIMEILVQFQKKRHGMEQFHPIISWMIQLWTT